MPEKTETTLATSELAERSMIDASVSRQAQEVQAMMIIAKRFPRDIPAATQRIRKACQRPGLAAQACYAYPRGGTSVTGPSIRLAEVIAQNYGNIDIGLVEMEQKLGESIMLAYAWDVETNTRITKVFTVPHKRHTKQGTKPLTDPRDIYEMTANQGARRLRACILAVVPGDVIDTAVEECEKTLLGDGEGGVAQKVAAMVSAFADIAVSTEMLEARLGHRLDVTTIHEVVGLRKIYQSIKDNMAGRKQYFEVGGLDESGGKSRSDALREKIEADRAAKAQEAAPPELPAPAPADEEVPPDEEAAPDPLATLPLVAATGLRRLLELGFEQEVRRVLNATLQEGEAVTMENFLASGFDAGMKAQVYAEIKTRIAAGTFRVTQGEEG